MFCMVPKLNTETKASSYAKQMYLFLYYLNEVCEFAPEGNISLRNNFLKLKRPFQNTNTGQKALSFIGASFWNQIPETLKKTIT